jgi:hypothetical protein
VTDWLRNSFEAHGSSTPGRREGTSYWEVLILGLAIACSVAHPDSVKRQGKSGRQKPDIHEQKTDDREIVDTAPRLEQ